MRNNEVVLLKTYKFIVDYENHIDIIEKFVRMILDYMKEWEKDRAFVCGMHI